MTTSWVVAVVGVSGIALAVAGCPLPNPCPFGMTPRGNRCVAPPGGNTGNDEDRANEDMPSATGEDASSEADDEHDAAAGPQDADIDTTSENEDADVDAEAGAKEGEAGSGSDGGDDPASTCDAAELVHWRNFLISGRAILVMNDCRALEPMCAVPLCGLGSCTRDAAGVSGCEACIASETSCIDARCAGPCTASDAFDSCRKCACDNGCMGAATGCGLRELDICFDCLSGTCQNVSTDPSIVMQIFNYGSMIAPLIP